MGLIDGTDVMTAILTGAGGVRTVATQTVVLNTTGPLDLTYG